MSDANELLAQEEKINSKIKGLKSKAKQGNENTKAVQRSAEVHASTEIMEQNNEPSENESNTSEHESPEKDLPDSSKENNYKIAITILSTLLILVFVFFLGLRYYEKCYQTKLSEASSVLDIQTQTTAPPVTDNAIPELININTADVDKLCTLKGIGEAKAQAIIDYRNNNGAFTSIEELMEVSGIGEATFEKLKDYITVE